MLFLNWWLLHLHLDIIVDALMHKSLIPRKGILINPKMGQAFIEALSWLRSNGANNLIPIPKKNETRTIVTSNFDLHWEILSGNYRLLLLGNVYNAIAGGALVDFIVDWNSKLTLDKQYLFESFWNRL